MDTRWNRPPNKQAVPESGLTWFLSRDGGIRTHDLSVPKSPDVDRSGLVRTKTAGQSVAATYAGWCECLRTRNGVVGLSLSGDLEEPADRLTDDLAGGGVLGFGAGLDRSPQLGVDTNRHYVSR